MIHKYSDSEILSMKINKIKEILEKIPSSQYPELIELLKKDERKSILNIVKRLQKKMDYIESEKMRMKKINLYEEEAYKNGFMYIGGVDEVGRGPLAGPVVAAVVILKRGTEIIGIDDSKKLSASKRESIYSEILENAIDYGIGIADNREIDKYNILNATYIAMKRAIENLKQKPEILLNDAVKIPGIDIDQVPIIKGDSKSISIAAASIIAKVTRDKMMCEYEEEFPGYGFSSNKGYGTKEHYEGLNKIGKTSIHRDSFLKNLNI
ncbi:ribonuclease HII [Peptostreptococcus faecalis]|uniref:ribonuclease HII n=1 Tax=Peptostreptococcus faecalis TaxID=2045015 RepID=UPI001FA86D05|nr:ribonuclease HII [Peptostreptococcus faecalis]